MISLVHTDDNLGQGQACTNTVQIPTILLHHVQLLRYDGIPQDTLKKQS